MLERYVQKSESHLTLSEIAFEREVELESLPTPDQLPADINWRAFDTELAFRVLSFAADVEAAQVACDLEEGETGHWTGNSAAIRLGLAAWDTALAIRKRYKLGKNRELEKLLPLLKDRKMEKARRRGRWRAEQTNRVAATEQ